MSEAHEAERRQRILVVDDDPETARLIRSWFQKSPVEILVANGGAEGLRVAAAEHPDLILLDLRMPDVDGLSVARQLKSEEGTRPIPIVLLTACREVGTKVEAFSVGAEDYITKPIVLEELEARILALLRRGKVLVGMQSKITNLTNTKQELERLLVVDEKTGLYNFREFQRRLKDEWERAQRYNTPLSLVMFDLDHFKRLNDTRGHQAGDQVLREFAMLVAGGARANDVAARYGGEEFAIVLPHTDGSMAVRVAERIRKAVKEFIFLEDEQPAHITVSAGVATCASSKSLESVDALVRAADVALYEAKAKGRDCVVQSHAGEGASGAGLPRPDPPRDASDR